MRPSGNRLWYEMPDDRHRPQCKRRSKDTSADGEHQTFRQSLSQQTQAACTECHANGYLALPVRGSRNHESGDVREGYEEDDDDTGGEHKNRQTGPAKQLLSQGNYGSAQSAIGRGILMLQLERNIGHFLSCGLKGDSGPEQSENLKIMTIALTLLRRGKSERNPKSRTIWKSKSEWHDAEDAIGYAIQVNRSTDDVWIRAIALLPYRGADENYGTSGLILVRCKAAAEERLDAEERQQV
jgi:hypothetical protein